MPRGVGPAPVLPPLPNLRDVGGHAMQDGTVVRRGLLYRSTELSRASDEDLRALAGLGIRFIYDLRTDGERETQPDRLPVGASLVVADVLADSSDAGPAALMAVMRDPPAASRQLGGGRAAAYFEDRYREFVGLASARAAYGRLFRDLASPDHRPALVHCTTGKDRTGWAVAALHLLLGVAADDVERDYLQSNEVIVPLFRRFLEAFAAGGGDPEAVMPLVMVRPSYLAAALDEVRRSFGSLEAYFAGGLGVDGTTQARLRAVFVESA